MFLSWYAKKTENVPQFKKAVIVKSKAKRGDYLKFCIWNVQKNDLDRKRLYPLQDTKQKKKKQLF